MKLSARILPSTTGGEGVVITTHLINTNRTAENAQLYITKGQPLLHKREFQKLLQKENKP